MAFRIRLKHPVEAEIECDSAEEFRDALGSILELGIKPEPYSEADPRYRVFRSIEDSSDRSLLLSSSSQSPETLTPVAREFLEHILGEPNKTHPQEALRRMLGLKSARSFGPVLGNVQRFLSSVGLKLEDVLCKHTDREGDVDWHVGRFSKQAEVFVFRHRLPPYLTRGETHPADKMKRELHESFSGDTDSPSKPPSKQPQKRRRLSARGSPTRGRSYGPEKDETRE